MTDPLVSTVASHVQDGREAAVSSVLEEGLARLAIDLERVEALYTEQIALLSPPQVPHALYELESMFRVLQRLRAVVEARAGSCWDEAVPIGGAWKGPDGDHYVFDGSHSRKVEDPEGLRHALLSVLDERRAERDDYLEWERERRQILGAFRVKTEVLLTPVNQLAEIDSRYRDARDDFATWKDGPKHLTKIDQTYKTAKEKPRGHQG